MRQKLNSNAYTMALLMAASPLAAHPSRSVEDSPSLQNVTQAPDGKSLVVGSIRYRKNRQDTDCGELLQRCDLIVVPPRGSKPLVYSFKQGGSFTWALPAGEYVIVGLDRGTNGKSISDVIRVPSHGSAIYVGELTFDVSDDGIRVWLDDNFDEAASLFNKTFPERAGTLSRQLIGSYGNPGTWENIVPICSSEWGVSCSLARQGLIPVLPTKTRGPNFLIMEPLPRFEWTPSKLQDVTYDIALFNAVMWHGKPYRGRMIAYQQGIEQSSWQLNSGLEPGRAYFWSVRLRKGNAISTWSTHTASYSTGFLGMNTTVAYGEWFRFDLPATATKP